MTLSAWTLAALAYHLASRLLYVVWVGSALRAEERERRFTRADGPEAGFAEFRRRAALIMNNDAASFVLLCVVTRQSLDLAVAPAVIIGAGVLLTLIGLGVKLWAARTLGWDAYYWHNFFVPPERPRPNFSGPYRYFRNPMYTVGNLHLYGLALMAASLPALLAAAIDHLAILAFDRIVERPHFLRLINGGGAAPPPR